MLTRSGRAYCLAASFTVVIALSAADILVLAQTRGGGAATQAGSVARIQDKPNLSGIWQAVTEAHWDLEPHPARPGPAQFGALFAEPAGLGVLDGGAIPYQPWAAEKKKENFARRWEIDPIAKCFMPGVPRVTYMPHPFQIVQGTGKILISYAFANSSRLIHMTPVDDSPADTWMGWSRGRWDGDTLVVDVSTFLDSTWFDRAGNFHSEALRVVERYTPSGPDLIQYEATIEDPKVFTRPWKISLPLYRRQERNAQLVEFQCIPFSEELLYGNLRRRTN